MEENKADVEEPTALLAEVPSESSNLNTNTLEEEEEECIRSPAEQVEHEEEVWNNIELVGLPPGMTKDIAEVEGNVAVANEDDGSDSDSEHNDSQENLDDKGPLHSNSEGEYEDDSEDEEQSDSYDDEEETEADDEEYEDDDESDYSNEDDAKDKQKHVGKEEDLNKEQTVFDKKTNDKGDDTDTDVIVESDQDNDEKRQKETKKEVAETPDEKENNEGDEENTNPTVVPRRTGFWDHDNRFADISIQESWQPQRNRKLWDKSEVNKWEHDKYVESEQGPKENWEVERSAKEVDERERGQYRNRNRERQKLGDFLPNSGMERGNSRGNSRGNGRGNGRGYRDNRGDRIQPLDEKQTTNNLRENKRNSEGNQSQDYRQNYRNANRGNQGNSGRQEYKGKNEDFPELGNGTTLSSNYYVKESYSNKNGDGEDTRRDDDDRTTNRKPDQHGNDNHAVNHRNRQGNNSERNGTENSRKSHGENNNVQGNYENRKNVHRSESDDRRHHTPQEQAPLNNDSEPDIDHQKKVDRINNDTQRYQNGHANHENNTTNREKQHSQRNYQNQNNYQKNNEENKTNSAQTYNDKHFIPDNKEVREKEKNDPSLNGHHERRISPRFSYKETSDKSKRDEVTGTNQHDAFNGEQKPKQQQQPKQPQQQQPRQPQQQQPQQQQRQHQQPQQQQHQQPQQQQRQRQYQHQEQQENHQQHEPEEQQHNEENHQHRQKHQQHEPEQQQHNQEKHQPRQKDQQHEPEQQQHQQDQQQKQHVSNPRDERPVTNTRREETPDKRNRGRGRGVVNSNFKPVLRADEYAREKSSREKRIDQLAPRLRDKAREKMVREEKEKGNDVDPDPEVFKDAEEDETVTTEEGVVRDKPKRYSSQRQKPGSSLLNLPTETPDDMAQQYYQPGGGVQQPMYNTGQVAMQQHLPQIQDNCDVDKMIKMKLQEQILQLQSQLHQHNLGASNNIPQRYPVHLNDVGQPLAENHQQQSRGYNNMESIYNMQNGMVQNSPVGEVSHVNPSHLSHMLATGYPQNMMAGGLYIPQHQQLAMSEFDYQQHARSLRPAAIPIKPPPGLQR